ncbi:MAG: FkbM family methyltransferase [Phycisphaerae bacterium]|nr:FkbM family methyltransferase [Phycisphaerae bacterium]
MAGMKRLLRRVLWGKHGNLTSLDDPWKIIPSLLAGREVTTLIDAGASDGRITHRLLRAFPQATAYLFEPNPAYAEALREYADRDRRVRPQLLALADRQGELEFYETASRGSCSLLKPSRHLADNFPQEASVRRVSRVPAVRLDDWARQSGLASIEVVKLDIQGAELAACRGGREILQQSTLLIYTEVWFRRLYEGGAVFGEIDQFLRELGFALYSLYKPKSDARGFLSWANALYLHADRLGI